MEYLIKELLKKLDEMYLPKDVYTMTAEEYMQLENKL